MRHPEGFPYPRIAAKKTIGFFAEKHAGLFPKWVNGDIIFLYWPNGQQEGFMNEKYFALPIENQQRILDAAYCASYTRQ